MNLIDQGKLSVKLSIGKLLVENTLNPCVRKGARLLVNKTDNFILNVEIWVSTKETASLSEKNILSTENFVEYRKEGAKSLLHQARCSWMLLPEYEMKN